MTTDIQTRDLAWARRITELLRVRGTSFAESRQRLLETIHEAQEGEAWRFLDYPSWTAYIADVFKDEPMLLERDARRSISAELHIEGMSVRAIAAVTGKSIGQTHADIAAGVQSLNTSPAEAASIPTRTEFVDTATGEILDVDDNTAAFIEADLTEDEFEHGLAAARQSGDLSAESVINNAPRKVTGLDGKTYSVPQQHVQQEPRTMRKPLPDQITNNIFDLSRKAERLDALTEDDRFPKNKEKVAARNRNDLLRTIDTLQRVLAKLDGPVE